MNRIPPEAPDTSVLARSERISVLDRTMQVERKLARLLQLPSFEVPAQVMEAFRPTLQVTAQLTEAFRPTLQVAAQLTEALRPSLEMTAQVMEAWHPTFQRTEQIMRAALETYATPVMQMATWAEEHRSTWGPSVLKCVAAFEQVAAAAERLQSFPFQMPTELDLCEEAYSSAKHGSPQDKQSLIEFTREYLGLPVGAWWRVGSALLCSNWRSAKDPVRYLKREVRRDASDRINSRMQDRLVYAPPDELWLPATNPSEKMESALTLQQAWVRSDPEVRELVAAWMMTDSLEEARHRLGWDRRKFQRVHQRLLRARPTLRRKLLDS